MIRTTVEMKKYRKKENQLRNQKFLVGVSSNEGIII